ncbi:hypothetical protein N2152v2_001128 [Parachlorella kessleri]
MLKGINYAREVYLPPDSDFSRRHELQSLVESLDSARRRAVSLYKSAGGTTKALPEAVEHMRQAFQRGGQGALASGLDDYPPTPAGTAAAANPPAGGTPLGGHHQGKDA